MKYSIITINFNNKDGLEKTIKSVLEQTFNDYQYIIIDGGSTDGSADVIKKYTNDIDYWISEPDNGIYDAMNKGIDNATGDYCIFMNSGDQFYNDNVLYYFKSINHHEDIIYGDVYNSETNKIMFSPPHKEISLYYLYSSTIPHQGAFIKTSLQKKHFYDDSLRIVADWKFFYESIIIDNCSIIHVNSPVCKFCPDGISTTNPDATWNEKKRVLQELLPHRILQDYQWMKASECQTMEILPDLRKHYKIDKLIFKISKILLGITKGIFLHNRNA